jgi:putative endonuclease
MSTQELGKQGEELVALYLEKQGFTVREKNYQIRAGEIDLIVQKGDILAFVEVKLRQNQHFPLSELIVPAKQKKIIKTALWYIASKHLSDLVYRFDVALIESKGTTYAISYIENAFTAPSY